MISDLLIRNSPLRALNDGFNNPYFKLFVDGPGTKAQKRKFPLRTTFFSLGVLLPFQPSMCDNNNIEAAWRSMLTMLRQKMHGQYSSQITNTVLDRINKMFGRLNFNTHRKSLAIIITPDVEKILYLNFRVTPRVFFSKNISALELPTNVRQEVIFYYLILNKNSSELHEFKNGPIRKMHEVANQPKMSILFRDIDNVIELLNSELRKPVFVTGSPNLIELFCNNNTAPNLYHPLLYHISPYSEEITESL